MFGIITAAGVGTRLHPHTSDRPKPMVPVDGVPILEREINWMKKAGVTDVFITEAYKARVIQDYFGNGRNRDGSKRDFGVNVHHRELPLVTGATAHIKSVLKEIPRGEDVLVMAGDVLTDLDPTDLVKTHVEEGNDLTLFTTRFVIPHGVIHRDETGAAVSFAEKPEYEINGSIYVIKSDIGDMLDDTKGVVFFEGATQAAREHGGRIGAFYAPNAKRWHISWPADLDKATEDFRRIRLEGSVGGSPESMNQLLAEELSGIPIAGPHVGAYEGRNYSLRKF